jgi:pimeloyl-ACP methyl ester carboxylesterase
MSRLISIFGLLLLITETSNAAFVDRIYFQWKQKREAQMETDHRWFSELPFANGRWKDFFRIASAETGVFAQRLDHFENTDDRKFDQRFWIDSNQASEFPDAPVLYYICGESRCYGPSTFVKRLAGEIGAHIVTLEHRYYGESIPAPSYSAKNLRFLSTDAALADLAAFQAFATEKWNLKGPWIAIGGSYPGSLAAYYRVAYPKLTLGALASSAPVEARAAFEEYDYQVATVVPPKCLARIHRVVETAERALDNGEDRAVVKKIFKSSNLPDDDDFLYAVADMAAATIQYGERKSFCDALESATDESLLRTYAEVALAMLNRLGVEPIDLVAEGNLSEDPRDYTESGMRQWFYQSCTEYGYWQVAYPDPRYSARSSRIDLAYHDRMCDRLFGIRRPVDTRYINRTYYEPLIQGKTDRVLFTNGSDDPWKHLSIVPARGNVSSEVAAMEISGAAHCDDLGAGDQAEVRRAQDLFRSLLKDWLD